MVEENISPEINMKNIAETRNFIDKINQNELKSKKHKKISVQLSIILNTSLF